MTSVCSVAVEPVAFVNWLGASWLTVLEDLPSETDACEPCADQGSCPQGLGNLHTVASCSALEPYAFGTGP